MLKIIVVHYYCFVYATMSLDIIICFVALLLLNK
jgi:hypothetical protein